MTPWICIAMLLVIGSGGCADLSVRRYRDDEFLDAYRYALGERYEDCGGVRLCYQEFGEGDPVVILPGLGTSIDFWQETIPVLARSFHVFAVDLPGFGKSEKPDVHYDLNWIGDRILDFLDAKGLKRASIIGGSMGGHVGLLLAVNHPQRVTRLVMMGSTGDWPPPGPILNFCLRAFWCDAAVINYLRGNWPYIYANLSLRQTPMTEGIFRYQMALRANRKRFAAEGTASSRALRSIFYSSCRDRLSDIQTPVLLIWGASDSIHPIENARYFDEHIPNSTLVVVPESGHEVMIDQPEKFNRIVTDFLHSESSTETAKWESPIAVLSW